MNVKYTRELLPEDSPVRGNVTVSGDNAFDKEIEDDIIARLNRGDLCAWCVIKVTATVTTNAFEFSGDAYLGGCSYDTDKEALACVDEYTLEEEALADLKANMRNDVERGLTAAHELEIP